MGGKGCAVTRTACRLSAMCVHIPSGVHTQCHTPPPATQFIRATLRHCMQAQRVPACAHTHRLLGREELKGCAVRQCVCMRTLACRALTSTPALCAHTIRVPGYKHLAGHCACVCKVPHTHTTTLFTGKEELQYSDTLCICRALLLTVCVQHFH